MTPGIRSRRTRWLATVSLLAAIAALPGCSSSSAPTATATLRVLGGDVQVDTGSGTFAAGASGQVLQQGNTVRTGDGRAAIEYVDGSITRLDRQTTFTLSVLVGDAASPIIEGSQVSGNTYHRVAALTDAESRFDVVTPTATATVEGTAFALFLSAEVGTTVVVVDRSVRVEAATGSVEVEAGLAVSVATDGTLGAVGPTPDLLANGEWLVFNRSVDEDPNPLPLPDNAFFEAVPASEWIGLNYYPPGAKVAIEVREEAGGPVIGTAVGEIGPDGFGHVDLGMDLQVGQHVTVVYAGAGGSRETTVVPLAIARVDPSADRIEGVAEPGALVVVFVAPVPDQVTEFRRTADASGVWHVVTAEKIDLLDSYLVTARVEDPDGDTTLAFEP